MPIYQGVEKLKQEGDHLQWGGAFLYKDGQFSGMADGRGAAGPQGRRQQLYLATRRGKQFRKVCILGSFRAFQGTPSFGFFYGAGLLPSRGLGWIIKAPCELFALSIV